MTNQRPLFSILHTSARPHKWREIYDAWIDAAVNPEQVEYVLCIDTRWGFDIKDESIQDWMSRRNRWNIVCLNTGRRCYVDGVNQAGSFCTGQILIVIADDQYPCKEWDDYICHAISRNLTPIGVELTPIGVGNYATKEDFCLEISTGTPDEHARGTMVMPILSRARYQRLGYVFYPQYESMYADNDFCEHAKQDGVVIDARHLMFPHKHPINGQAEIDDVYRAQNRPEAYELGERILEARRRSKFRAQSHLEPTDPQPAIKRSIALCLPGEQFSSEWVHAFSRLRDHLLFNHDFLVHNLWGYTSNVYVTRMEMWDALQSFSPRPDLILWIDDDNTVSPENFDQLLRDLDTNAVAGVTGWCWCHDAEKQRFHPSCGLWAPDHIHWDSFDGRTWPNETRPVHVEATGFPCFLMRGSMLERLKSDAFLPVLDGRQKHGIAGEDLSFCLAAENAGIEFLADPRVRVPHLKTVEVNPVFVEEGAAEPPSIAVMMRVKNEARWIKRCIESVRDLGPVFVLDDGSTDDTRNIAIEAGATVFSSPYWDQELDEARDKNYLLNCVKGEARPAWVLCIDGDEELEPGGAEKIKRFLASNPKQDVIALRFLFLWDSVDQVRLDNRYSSLTRKSLFRATMDSAFQSYYENPNRITGHKQPHVGLHTGNAPDIGAVAPAINVFLLHYGYLFREDRIRKYHWYNQIDPGNEFEDQYRHMVIGDIPELPAHTVTKYGGPLELRKLPPHMIPKFDIMPQPLSGNITNKNGESSGALTDGPSPVSVEPPRAIRLNLGCCDHRVPGYQGIDICGGPAVDQVVDLSKAPWPWEDSSVQEILAADVIEHLPNKTATMNELWRVLEPGGCVKIVVPTTDGPGAFQDPTHVSFWNRNSFHYFEDRNIYRERFAKSYGIQARFRIVDASTKSSQDGPKLYIVLEAVKAPLAVAAD